MIGVAPQGGSLSQSPGEREVEDAWADALLAAALFAVDPIGLGGVAVRSGVGPVLDVWLNHVQCSLDDAAPWVRMPSQIGDERLLGGLDLAATLRLGRPVHQSGLLADADGGVILVPMAERLAQSTAAQLASALDRGEVNVERDGISARNPTRFGLIALDEGSDEDERLPDAISDRLAFHVHLAAIPWHCTRVSLFPDVDSIAAARGLILQSNEDDAGVTDAIAALTASAAALGIQSLRAPSFALRAARANAALRGHSQIEDQDLRVAARLVFGPRATHLPPPPQDETEHPDQGDTQPEQPPQSDADKGENDRLSENREQLEDIVLDAAVAAIPKDLLLGLASAASSASRAGKSSGQSGPARRTRKRGRPIGTGRGELGSGARLAIVDTLRAAAPWQRLRQSPVATVDMPDAAPRRRRISVHPEDFRFRRYAERSEALTIFIVDASGSTALHRLGEAKGAVELLLADCYVRRDYVALVALRGREAELVLPPTRALTKAKRSLAGLPGGGGTPLASGIEKSLALALCARRRDQHPTLVVLTDGAANVARGGKTGRRVGEEDALVAGRQASAYGLPTLLIDTGPRPSLFAAQLADCMNGRYFALPMADAKALSDIVKSASANG